MSINVLAVIVAAVVNMIIGSLWYSKALFANAWMREAKVKMEDVGGVGLVYGAMAVVALVQALMLAVVVHWRGADSVGLGLKVGLVVWLGFVAATFASNYLFEKRTLKLYAINVGYFLVVLLVNGALLAAWH
jgi:hypothetical protein